jgi:hypothetical protein
MVLMEVHADARAAEPDAFVLEADALLHTGFAGQKDPAARADHAMPGDTASTPERPYYLPGGAGEASGCGDLTVSGHLPARDAANRIANGLEHGLILH